jgi:hypothetical protein
MKPLVVHIVQPMQPMLLTLAMQGVIISTVRIVQTMHTMAHTRRVLMRQIPVDTSTAAVMVAQPPQPKLKDRKTGERALDVETGAALVTVDVMFVMNGNAEVLSITVPETGISEELVMGTKVALTGLVARPWENEFNGQKRHGIAFRAVAITAGA